MNEMLNTLDVRQDTSSPDLNDQDNSQAKERLIPYLGNGGVSLRDKLGKGNDPASKHNAITGGEADSDGLYDF